MIVSPGSLTLRRGNDVIAGAIVPGLLSLLLIPWMIYKLDPPELLETPEAPGIAAKKLEARHSRR